MSQKNKKPIVIITGSSGQIGQALTRALKKHYHIVGFDRGDDCDIAFDLTSKSSLITAFKLFKEKYGKHIAAVIHLAAYFDFTGEDSPLYDKVNVEGTKHLLHALQDFEVERFIFSSTMLVHQAGQPGETIDEDTPLAPKWAYPESKLKTEQVIKECHGKIPYLILRLAGLYDDTSCIPTLSNQIARTYERRVKSHLYAGDSNAGQAFIHQDDMITLFQQAVNCRNELAEEEIMLAGEPQTLSYEKLQDMIWDLLHDEKQHLLSVPAFLAKVGAWFQEKSEPVIPDDFDKGEKPFIKPFMIDMASDHYALDISKARTLLHWDPQHSIEKKLPHLIQSLKDHPKKWYKTNGLTPPDWMLATRNKHPETLRQRHEKNFREEHQQNLWARFLIIGLGFWLMTSPSTLGYLSTALTLSDLISGALLVITGCFCLSWRYAQFRWVVALIGLWLIFAPLIFFAPTAAAYLNDTLIGTLVIGFSIIVRPELGVAPNAALTGSDYPYGWEHSPSTWVQRLPIIILAFLGLYISRYMAAYQLGHIDQVWDPFFAGSPTNPQNGTEEIITSYLSKAWPVPDAGLGAVVYILEILTGLIGSQNRWRTMPWMVFLFGILIVPLGVVSITFIIIQPILLNTWCTLCLIAAMAMLVQIPYSINELVATFLFLKRRKQAGRPVLKILFTGDTDEGAKQKTSPAIDNFERSPLAIIKDMWSGDVTLPWNLNLCLLIGLWLTLTRITLGASGDIANADHLIGCLIITVTIISYSEPARAIRFVNLLLAMALFIIPFVYGANLLSTASSLLSGLLLFIFSLPRGPIRNPYGTWDRYIF